MYFLSQTLYFKLYKGNFDIYLLSLYLICSFPLCFIVHMVYHYSDYFNDVVYSVLSAKYIVSINWFYFPLCVLFFSLIGTFWLDIGYYEFTFSVLHIFYFYKYSWDLFSDMVKSLWNSWVFWIFLCFWKKSSEGLTLYDHWGNWGLKCF